MSVFGLAAKHTMLTNVKLHEVKCATSAASKAILVICSNRNKATNTERSIT